MQKRIGIFQYEWPLQIHTANLATRLAESGFHVDVYLYQCDSTFIDLPALIRAPGVGVHQFKRNFFQKVADRLVREARRILNLEYHHPYRIAGVVRESLGCVAGNDKYDYFIGVEKMGLVWAGMLAEKLGVPFLYYSLELYIEGNLGLDSDRNFARIRQKEKKYHARAAGTIIQDQLRAKALFASNGVEAKNAIYFPVSVAGEKILEPSRFLHEKLGIEFTKKIILYIGQVCKDRGADELIACASRLGEDFVMVLHGPFSPDIATEGDFGGKVFFSMDMISNEDIPKLISSASIGIAIYDNTRINDRLTAFSSEKIAYYMQSGLPIIARRNESYELLMREYRCGELVEHIHQLPEAVGKIAAEYALYRENAFAAFDHYYSFDTNIRALTEYLSSH